jgi:predicted dehydrogenase
MNDDGTDPFAIAIDLGPTKGRKRIILDKPRVEESNAIKEELRTFAQSINENTAPVVTLEDAHLCLETAFKIIEKIDSALLTRSSK